MGLTGRAAAACLALACLLAGCAPHAAPPRRAHAGGPTVTPGFALTNFTGSALRAVYLSPSGSGGWEENVLGGDELSDGETVEIRFSPAEKADVWDMRVESAGPHFAEWKGLRLGGASRVTLLLDVVGERVVVAEVE